jgi:Domain of unknown function DUF488
MRKRGTLFLFGYSGRQLSELQKFQARYKAIVIDARLSPRSRRAEWNRSRLEASLPSYVWAGDGLGNVNYKSRGSWKLARPRGWLDRLLALLNEEHRNVILLCLCPDLGKCHRSLIVKRLLRRDPTMRVREV